MQFISQNRRVFWFQRWRLIIVAILNQKLNKAKSHLPDVAVLASFFT